MKYIYITFFTLFALFVSSCKEHTMGGYKDSLSCPNESLYAKALNNNFILASPRQLFLWDSLLVVIDKRNNDNLFYLFSTHNGTFLKGGGKKGEGPGEVLSPHNAHLSNKGTLSFWDINKDQIIEYNINELLSGTEKYYHEHSLSRTESSTTFLDVIALNSQYLYNGNSNKHIGIYGLDSYIDSPILPDVPSMEISRAIMNKAHWEIAPNKNKMLRATSIGGIVQCYTIKENKIEECWNKKFFPPIYKLVEGVKPTWITWCKESQMGFDNLYVTDQYIYLLLNGKFAKDKPFANEILIMDWNGNLKKKFILNKTISTIAVDEKKQIIYATTCGFDIDPSIVMFPF